MNIPDYIKTKSQHQKTSWVTCYDYSSALTLSKTDVTGVLIGDSIAMTLYGHETTLGATTEMIANHTQAVAKGLASSNKLIIADLPFLSYRGSLDSTIAAVSQLMRAGANGIKLEGSLGNGPLIRHLVESGVPVMGHLGLTPQSLHTLGGFKVQAKSLEAQEALMRQAQELEQNGCFSLVLECVPNSIAAKVTQALSIPVIGIGAGPSTDGQILVWQDLLGIQSKYSPKFVRRFANLEQQSILALQDFHTSVLNGTFPSEQESYGN